MTHGLSNEWQSIDKAGIQIRYKILTPAPYAILQIDVPGVGESVIGDGGSYATMEEVKKAVIAYVRTHMKLSI